MAWHAAPGNEYWVWDRVLSLETALNEGALFGMGAGLGWVFIALSVVAAAGIGYWVFFGAAGDDWTLTVALASITGGIFGNLYDRLGLPGLIWKRASAGHGVGDPVYAVRDWIHVQYGAFNWPNFNIADSLLVCGVGLLFWHAYVVEPRRAKADKKNETPAGKELKHTELS